MIDDVEAFAAAAARLDAGAPDAWTRASDETAAQAHWAAVFRREAVALSGNSLERYVRAYAAAADNAPVLPTSSPEPRSPEPFEKPPLAAAPHSAVAAVPTDDVPSDLRATSVLPAAVQVATAVPTYLAATSLLPTSPIAPIGRLTTMADPRAASPVTPFAPPLPATPASPRGGVRSAPEPQSGFTTAPGQISLETLPFQRAPATPEPQSGLTTAPGQISLETLPFQRAPATPGGKPVRVDLAMMPLERYAELAFALASGEPRESVLRRFVLTEDVWQAIATAWGEKVRGDAALKARFDRLIAEQREAAARSRRGT